MGLVCLFKFEHNAWIHSFIAIIVVIVGLLLHLNTFEWVSITFVIGLVFTVELINSAIERAVDIATKEMLPLAKQAKDMAAAAVLIASLISVIIALLIFGPKLIELL